MTPVKLRWELKDSKHEDWKGQRFTSLERAMKELDQAIPTGRFYLWDRLLKERVNY